MSKKQESDTTKDSTRSSAKATRSTATIQEKFDQEQAQGFRGTEVDSTPNENYTVAGVTADKPTPETDAAQAATVRNDTGLGLSALESAEREKSQRGEK